MFNEKSLNDSKLSVKSVEVLRQTIATDPLHDSTLGTALNDKLDNIHQNTMIALENINQNLVDMKTHAANTTDEMRLQRNALQNLEIANHAILNDLLNFKNDFARAVTAAANSIQYESNSSPLAPLIQLSNSIDSESTNQPSTSSNSYDSSHSAVAVNLNVNIDTNIKYKMTRELSTIRDIWREYNVGINGNPSIKLLNERFPNWRKCDNTEGQHYGRQLGVYLAVQRLVEVGKKSEEEALRFLESDMTSRNMSIWKYKDYLKKNKMFSF